MSELEIALATSGADIDLALAIRRRVFVDEQGIALADEVDGRDDEAVHLLARWRSEAVGAARLLIEGDKAVLARIAVLPEHRGRSIAPRMIAALESRARELGATRAELHPHDYLEEFYRRLGYSVVPTPIEELGEHRLICMAKPLG